jgi:hypothetical protein
MQLLMMSMVSPHATAAIIDDDNVNNNRGRGGGASCPPPSGPSCPAGCRLLMSMLPTMVSGGGTREFGAWWYVGWRRKVCTILLICQVLIQPRVDNGGKRSCITLVGLGGRKCQAGGGGGGDAAPQG